MDELYLDNIDEYVNDHNKIVTYKWLSLTLGVHVNVAKQMLFHYLDHKRKESSARLHATYLVSGKRVDKGQTSHKVSVVREEQLEDLKSQLSVVVSVHVYSVQKAALRDSGPLYAVDYDAVKENLRTCSRFSAISCSAAVPTAPQQQQAAETPEPHRAAAGSPVGAAATTRPQKGIMGMFVNKTVKTQGGGREKKEQEEEQEEQQEEVTAPKSKTAAKNNPMSNFFGTQAAKKTEKTVKKQEAAASPTATTPTATTPTATTPTTDQQPQEEETQEAAAAEPPKDTRSKTKRLKDSEEEEEMKKKRRRIKKPEPDSDDDVVPDSPQQQMEPRAAPAPQQEVDSQQRTSRETKTRKRRRVLKSRTFVDDEGCIVTEKGYESESYSEDDLPTSKRAPKDPFPAKVSSSNKDEKKSQKKSSANVNKGSKQASIMGFFQKK